MILMQDGKITVQFGATLTLFKQSISILLQLLYMLIMFLQETT